MSEIFIALPIFVSFVSVVVILISVSKELLFPLFCAVIVFFVSIFILFNGLFVQQDTSERDSFKQKIYSGAIQPSCVKKETGIIKNLDKENDDTIMWVKKSENSFTKKYIGDPYNSDLFVDNGDVAKSTEGNVKNVLDSRGFFRKHTMSDSDKTDPYYTLTVCKYTNDVKRFPLDPITDYYYIYDVYQQ